MSNHVVSKLAEWLKEQIDTILALALGAICSILGILGIVQSSILASAILGTLTVIAFSIMRDRLEREKLQKHLNHLLATSDNLSLDPSFMQHLDETGMLFDAVRDIWVVQETGAHVIEAQKATFVPFLRKGGILRIVVTSPREDIKRQLALRSHDLPYVAIERRSQVFQDFIRSIIDSVGANAENLQVRFSPYIIDTSKIIVDPEDPDKQKRKAIVRYPGFRIPFEERIGITVQGNNSPVLFSHFFQETQRLFEYTYKVIFIVNHLYSKKTIMMDLVEKLSIEDQHYLFSLIAQSITKENSATRIEVLTSNNSHLRNLAVKYNDSNNYEMDVANWNSILGEIANAHNEKKVIFLDGLRVFLFQDSQFLNIIKAILDDPNISLFASLCIDETDITILELFKLHYRTTILYLNQKEMDRNQVTQKLENEIKSSMFVEKMMRKK